MPWTRCRQRRRHTLHRGGPQTQTRRSSEASEISSRGTPFCVLFEAHDNLCLGSRRVHECINSPCRQAPGFGGGMPSVIDPVSHPPLVPCSWRETCLVFSLLERLLNHHRPIYLRPYLITLPPKSKLILTISVGSRMNANLSPNSPRRERNSMLRSRRFTLALPVSQVQGGGNLFTFEFLCLALEVEENTELCVREVDKHTKR